MFFRFINIISIFLCMAIFAHFAQADSSETRLRQLEAKLIYEAASRLVDDEEYDKAIRRLDRIISEYPETEYARLAEAKKSEITILKTHPAPISGISRASLVGFGTLFSTWLGVGTTILLDMDEAEMIGLVGGITGPLGGLAGSMRLTRNMKLSDGQASLITFGGAWGIWQAVGTAIVADAEWKGTVGASMAGGVIGLGVSGALVRNRYITPSNSTTIRFGGIWGTWFAICGAMIANVEDSDNVLIYSMIGGDAGLITAALISPKLKMSNARARLINISGIVGTLYGLGTNILFEIDSKRDFWNILGISGVLGLTAGAYFTRNYDDESDYFSKGTVERSISGWEREADYFATNVFRPGSAEQRIRGFEFRMPLINAKF